MFLALFIAAPVAAILVRPIVIDLQSIGTRASSAIEVTNDRNRPMAVEIKVQTLSLPERGPLKMVDDSGKDFLIFPAIASIPPGGKQVFRIRYVGDPALAQSKLFMFATAELPVSEDAQSGKSQVQMLYAINSIVTVTPPKAKHNISVIAVERTVNDKGVSGLSLTFENRGAALGYIGDRQFDLSSGSWGKVIGPDDASKAFGLGLIPPNAKRVLFLPLADAPVTGEIKVSIKNAAAI